MQSPFLNCIHLSFCSVHSHGGTAHAYLSDGSGQDILPSPRANGNLFSFAGVLQRHHLPPAKISEAQAGEPKSIVFVNLLECAQDKRQSWPRQYTVFCF